VRERSRIVGRNCPKYCQKLFQEAKQQKISVEEEKSCTEGKRKGKSVIDGVRKGRMRRASIQVKPGGRGRGRERQRGGERVRERLVRLRVA
jgi:hypothetical protein